MKSPTSLLVSAALLLSPTFTALVSSSPVATAGDITSLTARGPGKGPSYPRCNEDNPFRGKTQYVNTVYAKKLETTIQSFLAQGDKLNAAKTRTVQKEVSTFFWVSSVSDIEGLKKNLEEATKAQKKNKKEKLIVPIVIYNLPERDCSAKASAGEFFLADNGMKKYKKYVDDIVKVLKRNSDLDYAIVLEPDSLGNIVTNLNVPKCQIAEPAYIDGLAYTISQLQYKNMDLYIDAAHSNWLGWPDNLEPSAKLYRKILDKAGKKAKIRGFAMNVSNYNAYKATTPDIIYGPGPDNANWSEHRYLTALTPYLLKEKLPAKFIVDQGRSGQQNIRIGRGHWCNIKNSGFGILPTTDTGDCNVDALVWVKPGGESDGTSDTTAERFDETCISVDSFIPAPEAGGWHDEFVQDLVRNSNPPLKPTW